MKLYEFNGGLYPPRVGIYLAEKGITNIDRIAFDMFTDWPPLQMDRLGPLRTVPVLEADDGTLIRSSLAILEYLEEVYPSPNLIGTTPEERAHTRVLLNVIDEAATQFGIWCHKGSPIFASREPQHEAAAGFAAEAYYGRLRKLDLLVDESDGPFLAGEHVTMADCVAMATLQFAEGFYSIPVPQDCPNLMRWYALFSTRQSAVTPVYPQHIVETARLEVPSLGAAA